MATKKQSKTTKESVYTEEFKLKGEQLVATVKKLINEGNVRKIAIKDKEGKTVASFPLTFGLVGALITPVLAAVGAIAALMTDCSISIERESKR